MDDLLPMLKELLETETREALSDGIGASPSAISRWLAGQSRPRPEVEGKIRARVVKRHQRKAASNQPGFEWPIWDEASFRDALATTFERLREILHRSGRLSSRNEALTELSTLLFAHVIAVDSGKVGISREMLSGKTPAHALKEFVATEIRLHLPKSLAHEISPDDFSLKMNLTEDKFAAEVIHAFETLAAPQARAFIRGAGGIDLLNDTFGQFLADSFAEEKELGQYLTPVEVVRFMVQIGIDSLDDPELEMLCDPRNCQSAGLILDPSCGVGSFLAEALQILHKRVIDKHGTAAAPDWIQAIMRHNVVGIDKSERMVKLALTNLALFGAPAANLHLANALVRTGNDSKITKSLESRAALILTNPPFGAEFDLSEVRDYQMAKNMTKTLKTLASEVLFMERYIDWLAPGGVLVAIVPDSVLTNRSVFESLRHELASRVELLSVVSLPAVTFGAAGTMTKTSVLHLRRLRSPKAKRSHRVYFANCQSIGYEVSTRGSQRRKVASGYNQLEDALQERLKQREPTFGCFAEFSTSEARWDATYHAGMSAEILRRLDQTKGENLKVCHVANLASDRFNPIRLGDALFQYIEISDVDAHSCTVRSKLVLGKEAPSRARKQVKAGDVLVSTVRPERKAIGVVPPSLDGAICSTGFAVLRCEKIDPSVLARLLQSDFSNAQIMRNNCGIAYPAIDESCLLEIVLPATIESIQRLALIAKRATRSREKLEAEERELAAALTGAIASWR